MVKFLSFLSLAAMLCAILSSASVPSLASGGGTGGGGGTKVPESRVTGYVTAIDYEHSTITVGASYYGTGTLNVTSSTKISFDNVNCSFSDIRVGDWAEARYDWYTSTATKLACASVPTP